MRVAFEAHVEKRSCLPGLFLAVVLLLETGFGFFLPAYGQTYSAACPIAGRYSVMGRNPGATGTYQGEAIISASGSGCYMKWFPPNASEGTGSYSGGVLTINFTFAANGGSGVVKYTLTTTGEFQGVWWMNGSPNNQGSETLRPISLAPQPSCGAWNWQKEGVYFQVCVHDDGSRRCYEAVDAFGSNAKEVSCSQ